MKLDVTGGAGFIGSNFVRWEIASDPSVEVTTLDALIYAGNLANLEPVRAEARHRFVHGDVADRDGVFRLLERKSTRLNSSHVRISYAVFCLKKKKQNI